ncbi:restriction endonuclease subunit S [Anoxybacillus kestanbolensis]|uniref:restriction endonuclease subunit S n=1 Tax=Anoxybacillus kestanbolensis TaxID=227476 RepID=UPI003D245F87
MVGEWKKVSMKDNLEILTGYAFSSKNFNEEEGIPLIRIRDLETHNPVTLYKGDYDDKYIINKGDILVGMDGEFNIVRWKGPKALLNQRVAKINSKNPDIISEDFIFYRLQGELRKIEALTPATTVKHLSKKDIEDLNLLLPPLGEQSKIASILSSVDEAIEKTEAIIEQTEKVKKGLMQQLLTKGIGHTKFKKTEIGEIPEQWEIRKLNQVSTRITEKNKGKTDRVLTISGLHGLVSQTEYFNKSVASKNIDGYYYLKKGDFAYNKSYSDGYPLGAIKMLERYPDGVVSTLYICFRINENMCKDYFRYYFESNLWNSEVSAIAPEGGRSHGLLNVGVNDFFNIFIPIPPIEEQYKISSIIRSVENKEKLELEKLEKLKTIKKGLMQALLTGKVRVKVDDEVMSQ